MEQRFRQYLTRHARDGADKATWLLNRARMEKDGMRRYRCEGRIRLPASMHLLLGAEKLYLKLGLDKVFPVRQKIRLAQIEVCHRRIPASFDGFRLLWISDLHMDVGHTARTIHDVCRTVRGLAPDMLVYGGDYRHGHSHRLSEREARLFSHIGRITLAVRPSLAVALLGNHDLADMLPHFARAEARPLVNEGLKISRGGEAINVIGVDDSYRYFQPQSQAVLKRALLPGHFNVVLAHSPHLAEQAAACGSDLFLTGHTHGGQFACAPLRWIQKRFCGFNERARGLWRVGEMTGYTSTGIGSSAIPVRTVESEALLVTLKAAPTPC